MINSKDTSGDLDFLIEQEKRAYARECFNEVWGELLDQDVDPSMIADIFIESALTRLGSEQGNMPVSRLLARLKNMSELGFMSNTHMLQ